MCCVCDSPVLYRIALTLYKIGAEEPLPAGGSCLLGSLNLAEFVNNGQFLWSEFENAVSIAVVALNEVLDEGLPKHPLEEQRNSVRDWRQIGLGIFGLADMLIKMGVKYGDNDSIELCDRIGQKMAECAIKTSAKLADKYGSYPKFNDSVFESEFYNRHAQCCYKNGLRNSQLLTIAPTGSISTMIGVSGGIEPIFANSYTRTTKSLHGHDETYKVYTPIVKEYMDAHGIANESDLPDFFVTSSTIPISNRIEMQSVWQSHIDASISSTVNLPHEATIEDVKKLYMDAWIHGLKGITVYRAGCAREGILVAPSAKEETKKPTEHTELKRGEWKPLADDTVYYKKKLRIGCGDLKLFIGWSAKEHAVQDIYVKKSGSGGCERLEESTAIAMSAVFRLGGNVANLEKAFRGIGTCPSFTSAQCKGRKLSKGNSCGSVILNAIKDFAAEMDKKAENEEIAEVVLVHAEEKHETNAEKCPECGSALVFEGGCVVCKDCGWSKCN